MEMNEENNRPAVPRPTPAELAGFCKLCAEDKMGEDTVLIPMTEVSSIADYFVVSTANSEPQLRAMAGAMERQVRERYALRPLGGPSSETSGWVLIDFGAVIVHLMTRESRERYDLEGLWNRAEASRKQKD